VGYIAAISKPVKLTQKQKEELDRRLASYHRDPASGSPWEEVKKRILSTA